MIIPITKPITNKRLKQLQRNFGGQQYKNWREYVLERDGHICQYPHCNNKDDLQVHHIRRFTDAKHLRFDTINGLTLCKRCHQRVTGVEKLYELSFFRIARANEEKFKKRSKDTDNS